MLVPLIASLFFGLTQSGLPDEVPVASEEDTAQKVEVPALNKDNFAAFRDHIRLAEADQTWQKIEFWSQDRVGCQPSCPGEAAQADNLVTTDFLCISGRLQ